MLKLTTILILLTACSIKHHVQVGDIERVRHKKLIPFEVMFSETGVNIEQAADLINTVSRGNGKSKEIARVIGLFQMGPRTGNQVFNEKYADVLPQLILKKCPSAKVTGLLMVRESSSYPVVSGEIIKVTGYCVK